MRRTDESGGPDGGWRPKLLYIVTEDWFFRSHFLPMARAARAAGYEVAVAARYREHRSAIEAEGLRAVPLPWRRDSLDPLQIGRDLLSLRRLLAAERPDVVHAIALRPVLLGGIAARLAGVRHLVCAVTGLGYAFVARHAGARLLQAAVLAALHRIARHPRTTVLVENADHAADFARAGVPPERLVRVPGAGVDLDRFRPAPLPDRTPVTAMLVARMIAIKGVAVAVEAVRRLADEGLPIRLRLVGEPDPDHRGAITAATLREWSRHPAVEWLGRREDVAELWAGADIALLPALGGDGLPKALIEALACGRPVVTTDTPGCRETVAMGENGILVPPGDAAALADALRRLAADPALRQRFGAASADLARRRFPDSSVAATLGAIYRRFLLAADRH